MLIAFWGLSRPNSVPEGTLLIIIAKGHEQPPNPNQTPRRKALGFMAESKAYRPDAANTYAHRVLGVVATLQAPAKGREQAQERTIIMNYDDALCATISSIRTISL